MSIAILQDCKWSFFFTKKREVHWQSIQIYPLIQKIVYDIPERIYFHGSNHSWFVTSRWHVSIQRVFPTIDTVDHRSAYLGRRVQPKWSASRVYNIHGISYLLPPITGVSLLLPVHWGGSDLTIPANDSPVMIHISLIDQSSEPIDIWWNCNSIELENPITDPTIAGYLLWPPEQSCGLQSWPWLVLYFVSTLPVSRTS